MDASLMVLTSPLIGTHQGLFIWPQQTGTKRPSINGLIHFYKRIVFMTLKRRMLKLVSPFQLTIIAKKFFQCFPCLDNLLSSKYLSASIPASISASYCLQNKPDIRCNRSCQRRLYIRDRHKMQNVAKRIPSLKSWFCGSIVCDIFWNFENWSTRTLRKCVSFLPPQNKLFSEGIFFCDSLWRKVDIRFFQSP